MSGVDPTASDDPQTSSGNLSTGPLDERSDLRRDLARDRDNLVDYLRGAESDPMVDGNRTTERRSARRVLLIEDNEIDARLTRALLKRAFKFPLDVAWFTTIADARADQSGLSNDLVLLDLGLPDAVGLEAVRAVRRFAPHEAIVVLSGNDDKKVALAALEEGAQDFLVKGTFDADDLGRTLSHAVGRVQTERRLRLAIVNLLVRSDELMAEIQHHEDTADQLRREKAQLVNANERLRTLDQAKTDFVAAVSHELRTPLTSIIGYVGLVTDDPAWAPSSTEEVAFEVIERNSQRLLALVEDLLHASELDSERVSLELKDVDMAVLIKSIVHTVLPMADERAQTIRTDIAPDLPLVPADQNQIERVMFNLLDNARKFSPPGSTITVKAHPVGGDPDAIEVSVIDEGPGVPIEEQAGLFGKFVRGSHALSEAVQGTGLGLSIVRAIIERHQGKIRIDSAVGEGTAMIFTLPATEIQGE